MIGDDRSPDRLVMQFSHNLSLPNNYQQHGARFIFNCRSWRGSFEHPDLRSTTSHEVMCARRSVLSTDHLSNEILTLLSDRSRGKLHFHNYVASVVYLSLSGQPPAMSQARIRGDRALIRDAPLLIATIT